MKLRETWLQLLVALVIGLNTASARSTPGPIDELKAIAMGSSALYLVWKKPEQENGVLTGYKIFYEMMSDNSGGPLMERPRRIYDPNMTHAKLTDLRPDTTYRIHVKATNNDGEGVAYFIEHRTNGFKSMVPDIPSFTLEHLAFQNDNGYGNVKVTWIPKLGGRPGSHFFVKYKLKDESEYTISENELYEDYMIVGPLKLGQTYEFKLVAVDGEYSTESETQDLAIAEETDELAPEIQKPPQDMSTVDGRNVSLMCRVLGAPKPQIKWVHNSLELTGGRYNILDNGDLEIRDVSFRDAGHYTCYASNKLGNAEASGKLIVKKHTYITDEPEDLEVAARSTATFRCNAVSDYTLELSVDWLNNGELIDYDSHPRFVRSNDYSLTITNTTELDSGTYTCVASTELDKAEAQATLTVQGGFTEDSSTDQYGPSSETTNEDSPSTSPATAI